MKKPQFVRKVYDNDPEYDCRTEYFEGFPVRFYIHKKTHTVLVSLDDTARIHGYDNTQDYLDATPAHIRANWNVGEN